MSGTWALYYEYPEGYGHDFIESFSDPKEAHDRKLELQEQVDQDPDSEGVRVVLREE